MVKLKTINLKEETHSHLTQIVGMEIAKNKKKLSYSDVVDELIVQYEKSLLSAI